MRIASRWNPSCRQVAAASHGPTGHGLRPAASGPAGMSTPSVARSRDRCSAVSPCTAHSASTGTAMTTAIYKTACAQPPTGQLARLAIAAPQMMASPPSSRPPTSPTRKAASAFPVARQAGADHRALTAAPTRREVRSAEVMTPRYKGSPRVTIRLPCCMGGEIPTQVRLGAPATPRHASGSVVSMIEISALTKRYGSTTAVSDLTFAVRPGVVTGFLGPNGAGKSTTMRMILGLDEPASGSVTVNGRPPRAHAAPLHEVGGMLDPRAVHPSRSAYHHLLALAQTTGIRRSRVDEVIDAVGLRSVAGRPAGKFSLGMAQRLGIAAALLGDPATVVLDEPVNGLDVEGIRWMRGMLTELAAKGKTVFVSSHLMSEIAQTATRLIVIGKGRLIADTSVADFIASAAPASVRVRSSDQPGLAALLQAPDVTVSFADDGALLISGLAAERIGAIAASAGIAVAELSTVETSLEDAFVDLTKDAVEYRAAASSTFEEQK